MSNFLKGFGMLVIFFTNYAVLAQSGTMGVQTRSPHASAISEVNSTNKGVLLPRLTIPNILQANPVTVTPVDGLLAYKSNTVGTNIIDKKGLVQWNTASNNNAGSWNRHLYFKETPKTAIIGITSTNNTNIQLLDNADSGVSGIIGGANFNYVITSSGYLPNLSVGKNTTNNRLTVTVGEGTYALEISYLITAPVPDAGRGSVLGGVYYSMGYFIDFNGISAPRTERTVISPPNQPHRVTFTTSFVVTATTATFGISLGRNSGSSHTDVVNVIPTGSYYKIIKLK